MILQQRVYTITAAILCITLVGIALSLSIPLLSFALESKGMSSTFIGLNTAMGGVATILLAPFVPRLASIMGVGTLLLCALVLGAITIMGFWYLGNVWLWFGLRFSYGMSLAVIFIMSEFWITAAAPERTRGLVMGVYATVLSLGFATGPILLTFMNVNSILPYATGALIFLGAILPVLLSARHAPSLQGEESQHSPVRFIGKVPAATLAAFIYGAVETGCMALLPVYGIRIGFTQNEAALVITAFALGNVLAQIPLGLVSDRFNRFKILIAIAVSGLLGALSLPFISTVPWLFYTVVAIWGGLCAGMYTVGLAYLSAKYSGADLAGANAAFVMLYSAGLTVGPALIGMGMDLYPPHGMPYAIVMLFAFYLAVTFFWTNQKKRKKTL